MCWSSALSRLDWGWHGISMLLYKSSWAWWISTRKWRRFIPSARRENLKPESPHESGGYMQHKRQQSVYFSTNLTSRWWQRRTCAEPSTSTGTSSTWKTKAMKSYKKFKNWTTSCLSRLLCCSVRSLRCATGRTSRRSKNSNSSARGLGGWWGLRKEGRRKVARSWRSVPRSGSSFKLLWGSRKKCWKSRGRWSLELCWSSSVWR